MAEVLGIIAVVIWIAFLFLGYCCALDEVHPLYFWDLLVGSWLRQKRWERALKQGGDDFHRVLQLYHKR